MLTVSLFSLDEGMTGRVAREGRPVIFDRYAEVPNGHIDTNEDALLAAPASIVNRIF